uniref:hypothetical protein n=1 Tax=Bacteroides fragilis TaxID=817 RepID=UPI003561DB5F
MSNSPSKLEFKKRTALTEVRFAVKSGFGGFVSYAQIQFYKRNENKPLDKQLLDVFTGITCSTLREDAKDEDIEKLPLQLKLLANQPPNDTYSKNEAYSNPAY